MIRCYVEERYNQNKNQVVKSLTEKGFDCNLSDVEGGCQSLLKSIDSMKSELIRLERENAEAMIRVSQDEGVLSTFSSRKEVIQSTINELEKEVKTAYSSLNVVCSASLDSFNSLVMQLQSHHSPVDSHNISDCRSHRACSLLSQNTTIWYNCIMSCQNWRIRFFIQPIQFMLITMVFFNNRLVKNLIKPKKERLMIRERDWMN